MNSCLYKDSTIRFKLSLKKTLLSEGGKVPYEAIIPKHKIGVLAPRSIIENQPYQFYSMAPPGVILVMTPMGLREFSAADIDRISVGLDEKLDLLMERGVEIIAASGVPLPIHLGLEGQ